MRIPDGWKNCRADVAGTMNGGLARMYYQSVVVASILALEAQLQQAREAEAGGDIAYAFLAHDIENLRRETSLVYCLAFQAMWERQLRTYLIRCAGEFILPDEAVKAEKTDWKSVESAFLRLRGVHLAEFQSYPALDVLRQIGNVVRHGSGQSLRKLRNEHPDLWASGSPQTAEHLNITAAKLQEYADAIIRFWEDINYIYCERIERKHPSLEAWLNQERERRKY